MKKSAIPHYNNFHITIFGNSAVNEFEVKHFDSPISYNYKNRNLTDEKDQKEFVKKELKKYLKDEITYSDLSGEARSVLKQTKNLIGSKSLENFSSAMLEGVFENAYRLAYKKQNDDNDEKSEWEKLPEDEKQARNLKRAFQNTKKTFKAKVKCNYDELSKFITLTAGQKDLYGLVVNTIDDYDLIFSEHDLEQLKGVESASNRSGLDNDIRKRVIELIAKKRGIWNDIRNELKQKKDKVYKSQIIRKAYPYVNELLSDITDIQDFKQEFENFRERMKDRYDDTWDEKYNIEKYVGMFEFGSENGRLHLHFLASNNFIEQKELQSIWSNGIVDIRSTKNYVDQYEKENNVADMTKAAQESEKIADYMIKDCASYLVKFSNGDTDNARNERIDSIIERLKNQNQKLKNRLYDLNRTQNQVLNTQKRLDQNQNRIQKLKESKENANLNKLKSIREKIGAGVNLIVSSRNLKKAQKVTDPLETKIILRELSKACENYHSRIIAEDKFAVSLDYFNFKFPGDFNLYSAIRELRQDTLQDLIDQKLEKAKEKYDIINEDEIYITAEEIAQTRSDYLRKLSQKLYKIFEENQFLRNDNTTINEILESHLFEIDDEYYYANEKTKLESKSYSEDTSKSNSKPSLKAGQLA